MGLYEWLGNNIPTLLRPTLLLSLAIYHFCMTILEVIFIQHQPSLLLNLTQLRHKSFARLWNRNGAAMSIDMPGPITELLSQCRGLVLDIGPGSGEVLSRFDASKITAMYGAEPAADLHRGLLQNAEKHGFAGKYHALLCGAEPESLIPALYEAGVLDRDRATEVFDEICVVRVLCGVPSPRETIRGLYALLKPGGRMVVCEHVVNPWRTEGSLAARLLQGVYSAMGWPFFMGGCALQRHTAEWLREAGGWKKFDLQYVEPQTAIPFVVGELIKADA
ncbi:uncharacterized protein EI97DRAFT_436621 [Westerdykella ornata]|uniref:S-adenosyl-L-methionine-dependent methyltransferase n=1 Tax=Westerdykella ornata TaxID=318751 RepID=A0A6A6J8G6_WESOR|nr:uncharacterized protein EI97DRAFT_436621 [Westerdykella ornata]KAF2272850.1 hypothetical protein EI97DRAFT_436621 [Westerdykella ornata]